MQLQSESANAAALAAGVMTQIGERALQLWRLPILPTSTDPVLIPTPLANVPQFLLVFLERLNPV